MKNSFGQVILWYLIFPKMQKTENRFWHTCWRYIDLALTLNAVYSKWTFGVHLSFRRGWSQMFFLFFLCMCETFWGLLSLVSPHLPEGNVWERKILSWFQVTLLQWQAELISHSKCIKTKLKIDWLCSSQLKAKPATLIPCQWSCWTDSLCEGTRWYDSPGRASL